MGEHATVPIMTFERQWAFLGVRPTNRFSINTSITSEGWKVLPGFIRSDDGWFFWTSYIPNTKVTQWHRGLDSLEPEKTFGWKFNTSDLKYKLIKFRSTGCLIILRGSPIGHLFFNYFFFFNKISLVKLRAIKWLPKTGYHQHYGTPRLWEKSRIVFRWIYLFRV
jgi:hypothetical protein